MSRFTESDVEEAALEWLQEIGYSYVGGLDIAPGEPAAERASYADVIVAVKRILRRHGYPPDLQEVATHTVLEQAELLAGDWA
jgi:type I restriction enzyme R subunit